MNEKLLDIYILQFYFPYNVSSDQHIWYIYILRVMRFWVILTMTCIILFCLPCYSIPRSNCSFKKFLILTPEWNVGASGATESNIFFHCIRFKITFFCLKWIQKLYLLRNNDLQHFCTFSSIIKLSKRISIKNSSNIDTPRIEVFIKSSDRCKVY